MDDRWVKRNTVYDERDMNSWHSFHNLSWKGGVVCNPTNGAEQIEHSRNELKEYNTEQQQDKEG